MKVSWNSVRHSARLLNSVRHELNPYDMNVEQP